MLFKATSTIDIHFHDTYYVIGRRFFVFYILLILFFMGSLFIAIYHRFKNRRFNLILISSIAVMVDSKAGSIRFMSKTWAAFRIASCSAPCLS